MFFTMFLAQENNENTEEYYLGIQNLEETKHWDCFKKISSMLIKNNLLKCKACSDVNNWSLRQVRVTELQKVGTSHKGHT